jgi:hypothetical protein
MIEEDVYCSETGEVWRSELVQDLFPGELIALIGRSFLGVPYQAGTLEKKGRERLVATLAAFDCTTFVETVLALARCVRKDKLSAPEFHKHLKYIRYRGGKVNGYASRLHYFTDWLGDNEQKKVVKNVTRLLGGKPRRKRINFMTTHRDLYPALASPAALARMRGVEKRLSAKTLHVAGSRVFRRKTGIQTGDVVAFTTDQQGLDVVHTGFAVKVGRSLRLLHASSKEGAVVFSTETLPGYFRGNKKFSGLMVARFLP